MIDYDENLYNEYRMQLAEMSAEQRRLKEEQQQLAEKKKDVRYRYNLWKEKQKKKLLLTRFFEGIADIFKGILNLPTNSSMKDEFENLLTDIDLRIKEIDVELFGIDVEMPKTEEKATERDNAIQEYREMQIPKINTINRIRYDANKNPSEIVKEFNQIDGATALTNRHKILDYLCVKNDLITNFHSIYLDDQLSLDSNEFAKSQLVGLDKKVYSDDVDIKDINAAMSHILNAEVEFDFNTLQFVGKDFAFNVNGVTCDYEYSALFTKYNLSTNQIMYAKAFVPQAVKLIYDVCQRKHPELLNYKTEKDYFPKENDLMQGKNVKFAKWYKGYYQTHKDALKVPKNEKCYLATKICREFESTYNKKDNIKPKEIMNYLFEKRDFLKNNDIENEYIVGVKKEKSHYNFQLGYNEENVLDKNISFNEVVGALSYATGVPVVYSFEKNTFKSALWEVEPDGTFISSVDMPTNEYLNVSSLFKKYGEKTVDLFKEIAEMEKSSLLYEEYMTETRKPTPTYEQMIREEFKTSIEEYFSKKDIVIEHDIKNLSVEENEIKDEIVPNEFEECEDIEEEYISSVAPIIMKTIDEKTYQGDTMSLDNGEIDVNELLDKEEPDFDYEKGFTTPIEDELELDEDDFNI